MNTTVEQEILIQEENLTQATRKLDIDALEGIYADDIMFTGVTGFVCDKSAVMEEAKRGVAEREKAAAEGDPIVTSYDKEDIKVASEGNCAAATYRFIVRMRGAGHDINREFRTTNFWVKRQNRWQVLAASTTEIQSH